MKRYPLASAGLHQGTNWLRRRVVELAPGVFPTLADSRFLQLVT